MQNKHSEIMTSWIDAYSFEEMVETGLKRAENKPQSKIGEQWSFMQKLLAVQKHVDYNQLLKESESIIHELNSEFKKIQDEVESSSESSLDQIRKMFEENVITKFADIQQADELFLQMLILFVFFLKENQLGPSVYSLYAEEELQPVDRYGDLPEFFLDPISNKNQALQKKLLAHFSINGEIFYERSQFLIVFYLISVTLDLYEKVCGQEADHLYNLNLYRARHANLHEQNLMTCADKLETTILGSFRTSVGLMRDRLEGLQSELASDDDRVLSLKRNLSMLLSESSHPLIQHWKYDECEAAIDEAFSLAGINVQLEGKLGKRTKYQYCDLAQLVLNIETKTVDLKLKRQNEIKGKEGEEGTAEEGTQYVKQDDESILWEQPQLVDDIKELKSETEELKKVELKEVRVEDQLAI